MTNIKQLTVEEIIEQNRKVYNDIADEFLLKRQNTLFDLDFLKKYLAEDDIILDVGCGWGRLYQVFEGIKIDYTGLDQSVEMLNIARKKFPLGRFVIGEMRNLPFKDQEFSKVFCIQTFHHLLDKKSMITALKEMKRVLKDDGRLIVTNWNFMGDWKKGKIKEGGYVDIGDNNLLVPWKNNDGKVLGERYYHSFSENELRELFTLCGLQLEEEMYYTYKGVVSDAKVGENIVCVLRK